MALSPDIHPKTGARATTHNTTQRGRCVWREDTRSLLIHTDSQQPQQSHTQRDVSRTGKKIRLLSANRPWCSYPGLGNRTVEDIAYHWQVWAVFSLLPLGSSAELTCEALQRLASNLSTHNVYRMCLENGTWALRSNYSMCQAILHVETKGKMHVQIAHIINFLGHCISMVALLIAFFLFLCLRSIRCLRNIIHWNLITAFILRNATWFIMQLTMTHEVQASNTVWCRMVIAAYNYFHSTNFFWMFGEGCYLHTAIVLTYSTDKLRKWMFICIGWCIPFPIIVAWAIGKLYYDNEKCWFGKKPGYYTDYIFQGPMILVLVINFIFLFNIVRILMTKLRASTTSETIQYSLAKPVMSAVLCSGKAVKATLVLLPLLGITYMLFFVNPGEDEISQSVFIYFNSVLESFQGFFVSVFYCFLNSEVRSAVRKRFHRWQEQHSIRARMTQAMSIPTSPSRDKQIFSVTISALVEMEKRKARMKLQGIVTEIPSDSATSSRGCPLAGQ
ncbi:hypothetical protein WMY93_010721 [Mugilogobius chulae]|uniref:G-protein coupled receptors family 2 profile 2 domain-containing protein n=1 Tax=Mugilogobius chulae TaxID=88201 RepID=A0AAW0PBP8_9GOBI